MSQYRYATERANYAHLAPGHALLHRPGATAFPVRLASEIFQRCMVERDQMVPCRLYDPCCGTGYLLTVLGFLHGADISALRASDIDPGAVAVARQNLALLTPAGLARRVAQLNEYAARFGKESHRAALASAAYLKTLLPARADVACFAADALRPAPLSARAIDMVITDVPYGASSRWQGAASGDARPIAQMLAALIPSLSPGAVVAIVSDKAQGADHEAYQRIARFSVGKRRITILRHWRDAQR